MPNNLNGREVKYQYSMNIAIPLTSYNPNNIFLCDTVKNTVMDNSTFTRVLFSNSFVTLVGLHFQLCIKGTRDDFYFQKVRTIFKVEENEEMINIVEKIENNLLSMIRCGKRRITKLSDQLRNGVLRSATHACWDSTGPFFVLKITGIWETEREYGITYKVTDANRR